jgi:hypothetical protein
MGLSSGTQGQVLRGLRYLGTHPAAPDDLNGVDVTFEDDGVTFTRRKEHLGSIAWRSVRELSAFSEAMPGGVGLPEVWFLGVLAFLVKRRRRRSVLRLQDQQGTWLFEVPGIRLDELARGLAAIRQLHGL